MHYTLDCIMLLINSTLLIEDVLIPAVIMCQRCICKGGK